MGHFDSNRDQTPSCRAAPSIAFGQAMAGVAARCSQITISLDGQDFSQVEHTFASAANLWLTGRSACRRLMASDKNASPEVSAATATLNERYVLLLDLLTRAHKVIEALDVRKTLDGVRMMLVTAMSQPLTETPELATDARDRR